MKDTNQLYDWSFLEQYVYRRLQGERDEALETAIRQDDFLQTTVAGLEQKILENKNQDFSTELENKKIKLWKKISVLAPAHLPVHEAPSISVENYSRSSLGQKLISAWEELKYTQFQYVLGFNFSCVVVILVFCLWANNTHDELGLISQVEMPGGFKP